MNLFDLPETLSPRLAEWLKLHNIETRHAGFGPAVHTQWMAWQPCDSADHPHDGNACEGETEEDALTDLAKKLGIRLWNEE